MVVHHSSRRRKRLISGEGDRKRWQASGGARWGRATTRGASGAPAIRASSRRKPRPSAVFLPLDFGEEALAVFSSGRMAQSPALSSVLTQEWRTRICSAGELASWLLGPYACIEWVLLDPLPGCLGAGNSLANLPPREEFLDYLLGQAVGKHGRSEESHDDR